ncbi:hypothetical protein [Paraburkholderia sp. BR10954]
METDIGMSLFGRSVNGAALTRTGNPCCGMRG